MHHKFGDVFRRSVDKYCTKYSDCAQNECCVSSEDGVEVSVGVCRKRPNIDDACGLSASNTQCPCMRGTTCSRSVTYHPQSSIRNVSTSYRL